MSYGRNELRLRKDTGSSRRSYQPGASRSSGGGGDRSLAKSIICVCLLLAVFGLKSSSAKLAQRAVETLSGLVRHEADFSESADSVVSFFTNTVYSLTGKELPVNAPAPSRLYPPIEDGKLYRGFIDDVHPVFNLVVKPVGITIDDSHPSVLFSKATSHTLRNSRSFVDVLRDSVKPFGYEPRATIFISRVWDDRISKEPGDYFGGYLPLADALALLDETPGLEVGYHTVAHKNMKEMGAAEVRAAIKAQQEDFATQGVLDKVVPILAYPYGLPPLPEGIKELRSMGFSGAVLAFPGVNEGRYDNLPVVYYDGKLLTDYFLMPRVNIGAYAYPYRPTNKNAPFVPIDPWADFQKDVLDAMQRIYIVPK